MCLMENLSVFRGLHPTCFAASQCRVLGGKDSGGDDCTVGPGLVCWVDELTGNHGFYHQIWVFPVNCPINQHLELLTGPFRHKEISGGKF